jgi:hypothetical protein
VRPDAVFDKSKPISGGIPHCFPQFGPGVMQQHGFARNLDWEVRCGLRGPIGHGEGGGHGDLHYAGFVGVGHRQRAAKQGGPLILCWVVLC